MKQLKNQNDVEKYLRQKIEQALDLIIEEIKKQNEAIITKHVYDAGTPEEYQRTYEFRDVAWDVTKAKSQNNTTQAELYYDGEAMTYNPYLAQHGSEAPNYDDAREYLAEIIYQGKSGEMYGSGYWTRKRNAFFYLVKKLNSGWLNQTIKRAFKQVGLTVIDNSYSAVLNREYRAFRKNMESIGIDPISKKDYVKYRKG